MYTAGGIFARLLFFSRRLSRSVRRVRRRFACVSQAMSWAHVGDIDRLGGPIILQAELLEIILTVLPEVNLHRPTEESGRRVDFMYCHHRCCRPDCASERGDTNYTNNWKIRHCRRVDRYQGY